MNEKPRKDADKKLSRYEPPQLLRVAIRSTRDHLNFKYGEAGSLCTIHNHDAAAGTCEEP